MIPTFKICPNGCNITITGTSLENGLYSDIQGYETFKYTDTCTINILELIKSEQSTIKSIKYSDHTSNYDESHMQFSEDGYYVVTQIILPTLEWAQNMIKEDSSFFDYYNYVYVIDSNNIIYKLVNGRFNESSIEEVFELDNENLKTTIFRASKETFSLCYLWKCYVNICKNLLNSDLSKCKNKNSDELTFNRDLVWMVINVIQYYIEKGFFAEAQLLLEQINGCNGVCENSDSVSKKGKSCGCGN